MTRIYTSYCKNEGNDIGSQDAIMSQSSKGSEVKSSTSTFSIEDTSLYKLAQFKKMLESKNSLYSKSEVKMYLSEKCKENDTKF